MESRCQFELFIFIGYIFHANTKCLQIQPGLEFNTNRYLWTKDLSIPLKWHGMLKNIVFHSFGAGGGGHASPLFGPRGQRGTHHFELQL